MTMEAVIVALTVVGVVTVLATTRIAADAVLVAALTILLVVPVADGSGAWRIGVLSAERAFLGFANTGLATIAALFVVVTGLRETGAIDRIGATLLGRPRGTRRAVLRLSLPVCGLSAFLNNTPIVAMMIPAVIDWAKRLNISPSKLMIPLSYAAILGGTCSIIGTSTNLVVAGLVKDTTSLPELRLFDIASVGLPCAIAGIAFLAMVGPALLPDRRSPGRALEDPREYTAEMIVPEGSPLHGQSIEDAALRQLPDTYIVEIERNGERIVAVGPDHRLHSGDRLVFVGAVEAIRELQNFRGLRPATDQVFKLDAPRYRRCLFEAVVSSSNPLVGRTVRAGRFRTVYDAAVIAVARQGERVRGKIGDIELRAGDTLLLEAHPNFEHRERGGRDFILVRALEDSTPRRHERAWLSGAIALAMVLTVGLEVISMLQAALVAAGLMVLTRCCTLLEARRGVDWSLLVAIGAAFGLGRAIDSSGLAESLVGEFVRFAGDHPLLVLAAIYIATSLLTELITNNAAAVIAFPFAQSAAAQLNVDFMPFVIAIMMAASASFSTPLGYQTNLMVYGPGGYRFSDFLRIGLPMNVLVGLLAILLTPVFWPFHG